MGMFPPLRRPFLAGTAILLVGCPAGLIFDSTTGCRRGISAAVAGSLPVTYENVSASHLPLGSLGNNSMDARPADLDDDGDLDIVIASEFRPNVILINDGTGHFADESVARIPRPSHDSEDVGIADFDLDGDLDIVFVSEDDQTNEFYLNDGAGFFSEASGRIPTAGTSNAVLVAFVNPDSFPDIVIGNAGQNVILINDGSAQFTNETASRLPVNLNVTQDLEWGDVDGDGDEDLIEGNENGNRLLLNNGEGVFVDATALRLPLPAEGEETREADLGDVDNDGDLDLFLANVTFSQGAPPQNRLLLNDGSGFFTDVTATHLPVDQQYTVDGDLVDLDYDGDLDLATAQAFVGTYQVLLNDGAGHFVDHTSEVYETVPGGNGIDVEAADFTGDGLLDIYLTGFQQTDYLYRGQIDPSSAPGPGESSPETEPDGETDGATLRSLEGYPNPFRSKATVDFVLRQPQFVTLNVIDVAGVVVAALENDHLEPGRHTYEWWPRDLPAGRYFWRLNSETGSRSQSLVLLK